jgi:hypothetical protein
MELMLNCVQELRHRESFPRSSESKTTIRQMTGAAQVYDRNLVSEYEVRTKLENVLRHNGLSVVSMLLSRSTVLLIELKPWDSSQCEGV